MKNAPLPYIFTDWKRYLKSNGIKYQHINPLYIVTEASADLPALAFRFSRMEPTYVVVQPIPVTSLNVCFLANTADLLMQKLEKANFLQPRQINLKASYLWN